MSLLGHRPRPHTKRGPRSHPEGFVPTHRSSARLREEAETDFGWGWACEGRGRRLSRRVPRARRPETGERRPAPTHRESPALSADSKGSDVEDRHTYSSIPLNPGASATGQRSPGEARRRAARAADEKGVVSGLGASSLAQAPPARSAANRKEASRASLAPSTPPSAPRQPPPSSHRVGPKKYTSKPHSRFSCDRSASCRGESVGPPWPSFDHHTHDTYMLRSASA